tara:strand:- start:673 stop:1668 length:996 start_codon:yes stop_codon:yes gene_type:complete
MKFLEGECTPSEEQEVRRWLNQPGAKEKIDLLFEYYFENPEPKGNDKTDYNELLEKIHEKVVKSEIKKSSTFKKLLIQSIGIAASISLVVFSAYFLFEVFGTQKNTELSFTKTEVRTISRTTGVGEKLILTMADKTKITLNSQSEISFSSDYGKKERLISLKGEAFFEISPDSLRPFRVVSNGITTTALGTSFNVYARNEKFQIALTEGKVSVKKSEKAVLLAPGQMALWELDNQNQKDFSIENFNSNEILSWKSGHLVYDKESLGVILNDLALWYGVEIHIEKEVDINKKVVGTFANKNLSDVLLGLGYVMGFDYEIKGKNVQIKMNKPM